MRPSDRAQPPPSDNPVSQARGIVCAIPARWASQRLPGKPLLEIAGRPMIEHVYRRSLDVQGVEASVVLTDDERIAEAVRAFGGAVCMTPEDCASGTDRIAWAAQSWQARVVINIQGDEPLIDVADVELLADQFGPGSDVEMATLATRVEREELDNPNRVKVVVAQNGRALYFSRAPIPWPQNAAGSHDSADDAGVLRHVGIYAYRLPTLLRLAELPPSPLERRERLEQLRALEHGIPIQVLEVAHAPIGVDTEEDLKRIRTLFSREGEALVES